MDEPTHWIDTGLTEGDYMDRWMDG